jgi:hypothetical protein
VVEEVSSLKTSRGSPTLPFMESDSLASIAPILSSREKEKKNLKIKNQVSAVCK